MHVGQPFINYSRQDMKSVSQYPMGMTCTEQNTSDKLCYLIPMAMSWFDAQDDNAAQETHLNTFYHVLTGLVQVWESVPALMPC